jgi:hypothetical protein
LIPDFVTNPASFVHSSSIADQFQSEYPDPGSFNLEEFVAWVVSIVGAALSTFIIKILKNKFPQWFEKSSTKPK